MSTAKLDLPLESAGPSRSSGSSHPPRRLPRNMINTKTLSFWCPVMMVIKKLEDVHKNRFWAKKQHFWAQKKAILAVFGHKMGYRVTKWDPTITPNVKKVASRCGQGVISLGWIDQSDKKLLLGL